MGDRVGEETRSAKFGTDAVSIYVFYQAANHFDRQVLTRCSRTCRNIRVGEAYGQADNQSVKKPIEVILVRSRPALKAFKVVASITCWSRLFHWFTTRSEKK